MYKQSVRAHMVFLSLVGDVGFPIAGSIAAGGFVFLTLKFILAGVTGGVTTTKEHYWTIG